MTVTVLKSAFADIDIPSVDIATFLFASAQQHDALARSEAPRPLFVAETDDAPESLTLAQMEAFSSELASGLHHAAGVRRGDVVAVVMPNTIYYLGVVLAATMAGAACAPANPAYTARELHHQLCDSGATHVITTAALYPLVCEAAGCGAHTVRGALVIDRQPPAPGALPVCSVFDVLSAAPYPRMTLRTADECASTMALLLYSSGTTGAPKGVMLSHRNLVVNTLQTKAAAGDVNTGTLLAIVPMFHSFGMTFQCLLGPCRGLSTVVMERFGMARFMQLVDAHQVTDTILAPPIVNALVKLPAADFSTRFNLGSLQRAVVGAAPIGPSTIALLEQRLPQLRILQGYGMTEASPAVSLNPPATRKADSVGALLPNIDAKVIDDEGRLLGPGARGELCFRGPNIMMGYLGRPDATRDTIDEDGFIHTGDIGHIDADTHVYVTDRKKELIKYNGFQVAPAELEALLMQHPSVRDCAVAGVFDDVRQTEVPRAYLVLNPDVDALTAAPEVVAWLNSQVAHFKQLRGGFVLLDAIPKNPSGKILRRLLGH
ncbi:hypothetical protein H4R19_003533 [Coemansia spiralis]|nr:hypothetical protein H4R19_003533 [Coemansia spiralis]